MADLLAASMVVEKAAELVALSAALSV